jgi:type II restriction enzyme
MESMHEKPLRANIGEWSELYVLASLLVDGGAFAADENQSAIENEFQRVISIFECGQKDLITNSYKIADDYIEIYRGNKFYKSINKSEIRFKLENFHDELSRNRGSKTFEMQSGKELLSLLEKENPSASSSSTENDLELIIIDKQTSSPTPRIGFSIKSQMGGAATLLNASGATNFIYEIIPSDIKNKCMLPEIEHGKHKQNILKIINSGFNLRFHSLQSEQFAMNLQLLDSNMVQYLADVLLNYYATDLSALKDVTEITFDPDDKQNFQKIFKIKEFIGNVAMGMRPAKVWDGDTTKFRGLLLSKSDGQVLFYNLYNRKDFENYLYKNLRFDRPDTGRHKYGDIYNLDGKAFIKLNLQLRFKK